jgi:hypothetical protein
MGREEAPRLLAAENICIFLIASAQPRLPALIALAPEPRYGIVEQKPFPFLLRL